uniref:Uncharacterized protein n=1 Tax=Tanacetum cinerariifolium TaxID=118510 RepID=A0A6L2NUX8_TANCI|nr:hypothetical protein [Tanacetum cinerariifolium]
MIDEEVARNLEVQLQAELEEEERLARQKQEEANIALIAKWDDNMVYYLLVEKMYPFTKHILQQLWNDVRLQVHYEVKMAYDLLRLIGKHLREGYVAE